MEISRTSASEGSQPTPEIPVPSQEQDLEGPRNGALPDGIVMKAAVHSSSPVMPATAGGRLASANFTPPMTFVQRSLSTEHAGISHTSTASSRKGPREPARRSYGVAWGAQRPSAEQQTSQDYSSGTDDDEDIPLECPPPPRPASSRPPRPSPSFTTFKRPSLGPASQPVEEDTPKIKSDVEPVRAFPTF
jgi:hypothetical protein